MPAPARVSAPTPAPSRRTGRRAPGYAAPGKTARANGFAASCVTVASFLAGIILLNVLYIVTGSVLGLTGLLKLSGAQDFSFFAYLAVSSASTLIAGRLVLYLIKYYTSKREVPAVWLAAAPYCVAALVMPMATCIALLFSVLVCVFRAHRAGRVLLIVNAAVTAAAVIVFPCVDAAGRAGAAPAPSAPEQAYADGVVYTLADDGKYYVSGCDDGKGVLNIPGTVNGTEVGGILDSFAQEYDYVAMTLDYQHATDNTDTTMSLLLAYGTQDVFPVPVRDGYTFYGWWTSPDRSEGVQITDGDGALLDVLVDGDPVLYAMWFADGCAFVSSYSDFIDMGTTGTYVLVNDIEMPEGFVPFGGLGGMELQQYRTAFNGTFDGNFHTVTYSITGSRRYSGLFSWIGSRGTVRNLLVEVSIDVDFYPTDAQYYAYAGGIAAINDGTILNCRTSGSIRLSSTSVAFTGGIAGASGTENARTGEIACCANFAALETVADDAYAGGILGSAANDGQQVFGCYNRGTVKATGANSNNTAAGGIISHGRTLASHCFNAGAVVSDHQNKQTLGGIIGYTRDTAVHGFYPSGCVWLKQEGSQALWGVGRYADDRSGGNNYGVTRVSAEGERAVGILNAAVRLDDEGAIISPYNGGGNAFVLTEGRICLVWEGLLS